VLQAVRAKGVKAMAHITGGGFPENIPRVLPAHLRAVLDVRAWTLPPVFAWLKRMGGVEAAELARTFNCGIGMVLVVSAEDAQAMTTLLVDAGERVYRVGQLEHTTEAAERIMLNGLASWDAA